MRAALIGVWVFALAITASAHGQEVEADAPAAERSRWSVSGGLAADAAWGREVNPEYQELGTTPQIFTRVEFSHYGLQLEYALPSARQSSSSALTVRTETATVGAWGRYAFGRAPDWQPFVSLGGGMHLDRVRTSFQNYVNERDGVRRFVGAGGGLSKRVWRFVMGEVEGRVTSTDGSRRYGLGLILRLGLSF